jgi:hypothetical protein
VPDAHRSQETELHAVHVRRPISPEPPTRRTE